MAQMNRLTAECLGTFWLVFGGCGSAVLSAAFPGVGIGLLGVSLAFGLTVVTVAYCIGHISGAHLNPAVTVGLASGRRIPWSDVPPYIIAQVIGAILAAAVLYVIASGKAGFSLSDGFAANGYGAHSPGGYSLLAALVAEIVLTAMFLVVILGATDRRAPTGFAGLAIGLALTLIHLIGIPVTNLSVNPARSTGPALFVGGWALALAVAVLGGPDRGRGPRQLSLLLGRRGTGQDVSESSATSGIAGVAWSRTTRVSTATSGWRPRIRARVNDANEGKMHLQSRFVMSALPEAEFA